MCIGTQPGTQSYLKICVGGKHGSIHDLCSQLWSGSDSPREASFGTASCTMLTLSALPHNIARGFEQVDRLYPIGLWLRAFQACVIRIVYQDYLSRYCMHSRTLPKNLDQRLWCCRYYDEPCSPEFSVQILDQLLTQPSDPLSVLPPLKSSPTG